MLGNADAHIPSRDDENLSATAEYLRRAGAASEAGDAVLSMHLYLAAFEEAAVSSDAPSEAALRGLKQAWMLACTNHERALAEYIFEKMEPYLTQDEVACCMEELQKLAFDRLEEFGVSRADLEEMTQMISRDLMGLAGVDGMPLGVTPKIVKVEHILDRRVPPRAEEPAAGLPPVAEEADEASEAAGESDKPAEHPQAAEEPAGVSEALAASAQSVLEAFARAAQDPDAKVAEQAEPLRYDTLAGYDSAIRVMRDLGIGLQDDPDFKALVGTLNARHGLDRMPAPDTMLFRAPVREDAGRFVAATLGELGGPVLRMHMEENLQGSAVLCVTAQAEDAPKMTSLKNAFANGGSLVLEDIDLWLAPSLEPADDPSNLMAAALSRGAREAVNLIRAAVENPDVHVLVTASSHDPIDGFFLDLLEPITVIDIDLPTPEERVDIWMDIAREHPSIRGVNRADLVRLSANMPRYDIYMAAREAIEEAYKLGMMMRRYHPVTRDNIFDKLAAYQPLDSAEYHDLEEAVIRDFRRGFDDFEGFILGEGSR